MQKRLISLFLALVLVLSLAACGTDAEKETDKKSETQEQATEQVPSESVPETETPETTEGTVPETTEATVPEVVVEKVDTEALDELETQDTFAVRIIQKEAVKDAFDNNGSVVDPNGEDGYILTIVNNTGAEVNDVKFLVLATGEDGKGCLVNYKALSNLKPGSFFAMDENYNYCVEVMATTAIALAPNATSNIGIQCNLNNVAYLNAIVLSYIDSDGNEIFNENAYTWLQNTVEK